MREEKIYDVAVIGGGLAGLCLSVLLADKSWSVILFEKEHYPFNKVCGEYISMESWDFLTKEIGIPLQDHNIAYINKLLVTSPNGSMLRTTLDSGGFGISRYRLDNLIKQLAEKKGVTVKEGYKAEDVLFNNEQFSVTTNAGIFTGKVCCGCWGKRSNVDVKWKRPFVSKRSDRLNNYVGIKYHIKGDFPEDEIALHNFKDGYCGLSKIEDDQFCLCYFMKASNLKKSGPSVEEAEQKILSANPHLKKILETGKKIHASPVTISQVSLGKKEAVEHHVLMLGDAAGMISPLCGNGMSMAMHSAKIAAHHIDLFLLGKTERNAMETGYACGRSAAFGKRLAAGRLIQFLFVKERATNLFVNLMKRSRFITNKIISLTHGKTF